MIDANASRRQFMQLSAAAALSAAIARFSAAQAGPKPNVLLIIVDDLNNSLGCYGHPVVQSPNIDRLIARGMRFDSAYVQFPVCNPSRASFLTGLRPDVLGVTDNNTDFRANRPDVLTLPKLFRRNGYFTAGLGKVFHRGPAAGDAREAAAQDRTWDVAADCKPTEIGRKGEGRNLTGGKITWCRWMAAEGADEDQPDGQLAAEAVKLLEAKRDQPFFLAVGFHKPHDPFIAPKKYFDLYPLDRLTPPTNPPGRSLEHRQAFGSAWKTEFDKWTDQERKEFMRAYYAGISFTDAQVGKVMDALDRLKLADNTIVIFLGDNGYHVGERGWWNKNTLFELSCRVPMAMIVPGLTRPGTQAGGIAECLDIYPTLADLCGLSPPAGLQGRTLRPVLVNPKAPGKKAAFTIVRRGVILGRTVRTERWRYIEWDEGRQGAELYDRAADPGEYHNLIDNANHAAAVIELKALLRSAP